MAAPLNLPIVTLQEYASNYYRFAQNGEVLQHIQDTVFRPLLRSGGSCNDHASASNSSIERTFCFPPVVTNGRLTGADLQNWPSSAREDCATISPQQHSSAANHIPFALKSLGIGIDDCVSVLPPFGTTLASLQNESEERIREIIQELDGRQDHVAVNDTRSNCVDSSGDDEENGNRPTLVVVDIGCAEAVLRGSDVYAAGVVTATSPYSAGERVFICCAVDIYGGEAVVESASATDVRDAPDVSSPYKAITHGCRVSLTSIQVQTELLRREGGAKHPSRVLVLVGEGKTCMTRRETLSAKMKGVAVETHWSVFRQPSLPALQRVLYSPAQQRGEKPPFIFLQNYTSMIPPYLLARRVQLSDQPEAFPVRVLDACAAPGGKTSLLLSLLLSSLNSTRPNGSNASPFVLTCCERSKPRHKALEQLLHTHFASVNVENVLRVIAGDVNTLCKKVEGSENPTFDYIMLDPPCTGLGLRPKLLPHPLTLKTITDAASYQRKLFSSCVQHWNSSENDNVHSRRRTLVYSTCTITLEENEANVLWALETFPFLRLARAACEDERELCKLTKPREEHRAETGSSQRFFLQERIVAIQAEREKRSLSALNGEGKGEGGSASASTATRSSDDDILVLRFMPHALPDSWETIGTNDHSKPALREWLTDTVGFFIAVFEEC